MSRRRVDKSTLLDRGGDAGSGDSKWMTATADDDEAVGGGGFKVSIGSCGGAVEIEGVRTRIVGAASIGSGGDDDSSNDSTPPPPLQLPINGDGSMVK